MIKPATRREKIRLILAVVILAGLVSLVVALGVSGQLGRILTKAWVLFSDRQEVREYLQSWGPWAPIAFIGIQAAQVVAAPLPGEITGAVGGFLFGTFPTLVYSTIGLTLGSIVAFLAARLVGLPLIKLVATEAQLEKFHFVTEPRGEIVTFILFVIPGFPKDLLCYLLGLSPMKFLTFVVVCGLGRIPGTLMLSFTGEAIFKEDWRFLQILAGVCLIIFVISYLKRDVIHDWLKRHGRSHPEDKHTQR